MIDLNLIPFGLREKDGEFVDVFDTPRGKHCGCICPSCKTPLIARQGEKKEWHFAHATRSAYMRTEKECEFSFFVSVRMMARQVIGGKIEMALPRYGGVAKEIHQPSQRVISVPFVAAEQQKIVLKEVEIETQFEHVPVDIAAKVGKYNFIIFFSHPGRKVPADLTSPADKNCGVIKISLKPLAKLFSQPRVKNKPYKEILLKYLSDNLESKTWIFHPRYAIRKYEAKLEVDKRKKQIDKRTAHNPYNSAGNGKKGDHAHGYDDNLWNLALKEAKENFRITTGSDPNLPGWAGVIKSDAQKLFEKIKGN